VNLDDFETWVGDHLSEAIEEMRDAERSKGQWIVVFNNVLLDFARREQEVEDDETDNDGSDDLRLHADEVEE
jgi:hypothetical protein